MAETSIKISLELADKAAQKALSDFIDKSSKADKSMGDLKDHGAGTFQDIALHIGKATGAYEIFAGNLAANLTVKAFELLTEAAHALFDTFVIEGVHAAQKNQDAINAMNSSLAQSGRYSREASLDIQKFAESLESTSTFSHDVILNSAALIQSLANLDSNGLKRATQAAADLSARLGRDLPSSAELVAKAANGNVTALQKLGITIQKGQDNAETFEHALTALEEHFGGAAASKLNTYSGAVQHAAINFENWTEEVGNFIILNPAVIAVVNELSNIFKELSEGTRNQTQGFKLVGEALSTFLSIGAFAVQEVDLIIRLFQTLYGVAQVITVPLGLITLAVRTMSVGFSKANEEFQAFGASAVKNLTALGKNGDGALKGISDDMLRLKEAADKGLASMANGATAAIEPLNNTKAKTAELTEEMKRAQERLKSFAEDLLKQADASKTAATQQISDAQAKAAAEVEAQQSLLQLKLINAVQFETQKAAIEAEFARIQEAAQVEEFQKDNQRLAQARAQNLITEQEFIKAKTQLATNFVASQAKMDAENNKRELREKTDLALAEKRLNEEKVRAVGDTFGALSSLMQSSNRQLFEIGKASAIASATINTYEAITKTMASVPYPFNIPLAIAQGVAGFVQVANIANTSPPSFEQGGIVPGTSFTGDNVVANVNSGEMILNRNQQASLFKLANGGGQSAGIDYGQMYLAFKQALSEEQVIVNIGGRAIVDTVRAELKAGRTFA
jgi:hypothetical protein